MAGNVFSGSEQLQRRIIGVTIVVILIIFAFFGVAESNDSAQKVFWAAVQNSMNTTAVTVGSSGSASGETEKVLSQLDFGQHPTTQILTTLTSDGATAETETLTTPSAEYTRYDSIHELMKGKPINFTSVIGLWAKTASYEGNIVPPTFAQTLLGQLLPLPIGNLTASERAQFLSQIQNDQIYTVNFSTAKKITYNGRLAYVYAVSIEPVLYLQLVKSYAPSVGMQEVSQLNPNDYDGESDVKATWTIDTKSKELVKADYGSGRVQTYTGWGVPITTVVPTHTVTAAQLQQRLNKVI